MSKEKTIRRLVRSSLGSARLVLSADRKCWMIVGDMTVGWRKAKIELYFHRRFRHFRQHPPQIYCDEPWVRRDVDWHVYPDGGLCWVLPRQWRDIQAWLGKPKKRIAVDGAKWMFESSQLLLSRHLLASETGIVSWQDEWGEWAHGSEGIKQYERNRPFKRIRTR